MENREVINDVLVHLFNEIMELEEQAIITEEYKDITNNDMHIIEAVGLGAVSYTHLTLPTILLCGQTEYHRRFPDHFHEQPCKKGIRHKGAK